MLFNPYFKLFFIYRLINGNGYKLEEKIYVGGEMIVYSLYKTMKSKV